MPETTTKKPRTRSPLNAKAAEASRWRTEYDNAERREKRAQDDLAEAQKDKAEARRNLDRLQKEVAQLMNPGSGTAE